MYNLIVILGYRLKNNKITKKLENRLKEGLSLYHKFGKKRYSILVSGGKVRDNKNTTVTESSVMKKWLIDQGVPKKRIYTESRSQNTEQNIRYANNFMERNNVKNYIIVSCPEHLTRVKKYLKNEKNNRDKIIKQQ